MLAKGGGILIDGKSRSVGGDLEQHPTRLEEINRLEPEPIDDFCRATSRTINSRADLELGLVIGHPPGDVVYAPGAPAAPVCVGNFFDLEISARPATADFEARPFVLDADVDEPEHPGEERCGPCQVALPESHRMKPANLILNGHRAVAPRRELSIIAGLVEHQR